MAFLVTYAFMKFPLCISILWVSIWHVVQSFFFSPRIGHQLEDGISENLTTRKKMLTFFVGNHLTWSSFVGTLGARLNNMALDFANDLGFGCVFERWF